MKEARMTIASILATKGNKVVTIRPEQSIRDALRVLADHNIGALVAIDPSRRPVGILSERDVVRAAVRDEAVCGRAVSQLMTRDVIVGAPGDDLAAVGQTMIQRRIRHLPVVEGGKLIGMVSIGDVVKAQRDHFQGEVDTLQTIVMERGAGGRISVRPRGRCGSRSLAPGGRASTSPSTCCAAPISWWTSICSTGCPRPTASCAQGWRPITRRSRR